jgi:protein-S-isoprenylcysteine O-methyltransferase Ste14
VRVDNKKMTISLAVLLIISGISTYFHPVYYSSKYSTIMDYSNIKEPLSILLVFVGLALLWACWKDNKLKDTKRKNKSI